MEVEPWVDEDDIEYCYRVGQSGLPLTLTVWPAEAVIDVELRHSGVPHQRFCLFVADTVVYIHDERGEYLEFRSCQLIPDPHYCHQPGGQTVDTVAATLGYRLQLFIKPQLRLQLAYPHQLT